MATTNALIALGTPPETAKRTGWLPVSLTTSGTVQGAGAVMRGAGNQLVTLTVANASDAITLPSNAEIGDEVIINNVTANAAVLFPQSGGNINGETADESVAIAAQGSAGSVLRLIKLSATKWGSWSNTAAD